MSNELTKFEQEFGLTVNEEGKITTSSLKVAEYYGKEHSDVLKKIRKFIELIPELAEGNFSLGSYIDNNNQSRPIYNMDRQGFAMLVNKFTGDEATIFTYKYTKAFEEMAEELDARRRQSSETINALNEKDEKLQRKKMLESYFGKRKTVSTFKFCTYEEFNGLLQLFEEHLDGIRNSEVKRIEYERFANGLTQNRNALNPNDKMYMPKTTTYSYYIHEYVKRKGSSENKSYGQKIRYKDETIKEQQSKINNLNPPLEEYMSLDIHGLSNNYLYETVKDKWSDNNITRKTNIYYKWIDSFPKHQLKLKEELDIDWTKPIIVFLKFDCLEKFDVQNLVKSAIDQIITRHYQEDDNIVDKAITERNNTVCNYTEGKIYICIRNK
jgi:Rha family phage regulatory protein